jgi:hypothetical protein
MHFHKFCVWLPQQARELDFYGPIRLQIANRELVVIITAKNTFEFMVVIKFDL